MSEIAVMPAHVSDTARPELIWLGRSTLRLVQQSLAELQTSYQVTICTTLPHLLTWSNDRQRLPPEVVLIFAEYAGQWSSAQLDRLAREWPLTKFLLICDDWIAAELRFGTPWPGADYITLAELAIDPNQLLRAVKHRPFTMKREEHWTDSIQQLQMNHGHCLYLDNDRQQAEAGTALLQQLGLTVVTLPLNAASINQHFAASGMSPMFDVIVANLTTDVAPALVWLEQIAQRFPDIPWVLLMDFPRSQDRVAADHGQRNVILAKPVNAVALSQAIARLCTVPVIATTSN